MMASVPSTGITTEQLAAFADESIKTIFRESIRSTTCSFASISLLAKFTCLPARQRSLRRRSRSTDRL